MRQGSDSVASVELSVLSKLLWRLENKEKDNT